MYVPGGWYTHALPQRNYAALIPNRHVETSQELVPLPLPGDNPLYLQAHVWADTLYLAGQSHLGRGTLLWSSRTRQWTVPIAQSFGVSPCLFFEGSLLVAIGGSTYVVVNLETGEVTGPYAAALGGQGFRYISDNDVPVTGDDTLDAGRRVALELGVTGVWQYTYKRGILFFQGEDGFQILIDGQRRLVEPGRTEFIRVEEADGLFALSAVKPDRSFVDWRTREQLAALPLVTASYGTIVPVGGKHWHGFFEFGLSQPSPSTSTVPFNCYADVRDTNPLLVRASNGVKIAQYVAAEQWGNTPEAFDQQIALARRANPSLPVIAYWPQAVHNQPVPNADLIGVEMYWLLTETEAEYETRCVAAAERVLRAGRKVVGIPQCYTSNAARVSDLRAVVPVYSRIVARVGFDWTLGFSNRGRATGINDHPEVAPAWTEFFRTISGPPPIRLIDVSAPPIPDPPDPPDPPSPPTDPTPPVPEQPDPDEDDHMALRLRPPTFDERRTIYHAVEDAYVARRKQQPSTDWVHFISDRIVDYWVGREENGKWVPGEYWPVQRLVIHEQVVGTPDEGVLDAPERFPLP